jgi:hypothetical protein
MATANDNMSGQDAGGILGLSAMLLRRMPFVFLLCGVLASGGCGLGAYCDKLFTSDIVVHVDNNPDANDNSAVQLDFILAYSQKVEDVLTKLSAAQWSAYRPQFCKDFTEGTDYGLWSYQLVPGTDVPPVHIPLSMASRVLIVFAGYQGKGAHRYLSTTWDDLRIHLKKKGFTVSESS